MTVLQGEGRVPILYGIQPLPTPPHRSCYLARPDAEGRHPGVVVASPDSEPSSPTKALARYLARHGYAAVVPRAVPGDLEVAVAAFGAGWGEWSRGGTHAVVGIGTGSPLAVQVAGPGAVLALLSPEPADLELPAGVPALLVTTNDAEQPTGGAVVVYRGLEPGFWDDGSPDYSDAAARDAFARMVGFLDLHLGVAALA